MKKINQMIRLYGLLCVTLLCSIYSFAQEDKDFPKPQNPPHLVNDFANVLSADQARLLEEKLLNYEQTTSTQITVVTLQSIGDYAPSQYGVELFNRWNVGNKNKNNGVLVLAAISNHKLNITTGYGLEGALTDALCGRIIRNEMVPYFKQDNYYEGFNKAADAIIAATKGEYTADEKPDRTKRRGGIIFGIVLLIYFILWLINKIGGGGGNYMSNRGGRNFGGWYGGFGGFGSGSGWGGGSSGGGGFGGFGGGSSGGGGASGGW